VRRAFQEEEATYYRFRLSRAYHRRYGFKDPSAQQLLGDTLDSNWTVQIQSQAHWSPFDALLLFFSSASLIHPSIKFVLPMLSLTNFTDTIEHVLVLVQNQARLIFSDKHGMGYAWGSALPGIWKTTAYDEQRISNT
jgi:hypothetical protein